MHTQADSSIRPSPLCILQGSQLCHQLHHHGHTRVLKSECMYTQQGSHPCRLWSSPNHTLVLLQCIPQRKRRCRLCSSPSHTSECTQETIHSSRRRRNQLPRMCSDLYRYRQSRKRPPRRRFQCTSSWRKPECSSDTDSCRGQYRYNLHQSAAGTTAS